MNQKQKLYIIILNLVFGRKIKLLSSVNKAEHAVVE